MSFIGEIKQGRCFEAGYFLESEVGVVRKTRQIKAAGATTIGNEKYVLAGTLYENGTEKGIVYEDVNVTSGDMPGSVVLAGRVYSDRLPASTLSGISGNTSIAVVGAAPVVNRPTSAPVISATGEIKKTSGGTLTVKSDKAFKASGLTAVDFSFDAGETSATLGTVSRSDANTASVTISNPTAVGNITIMAKSSAFDDSSKDSNALTVEVKAS